MIGRTNERFSKISASSRPLRDDDLDALVVAILFGLLLALEVVEELVAWRARRSRSRRPASARSP